MSAALRQRIAAAEAELLSLRQQLANAEANGITNIGQRQDNDADILNNAWRWPFRESEYDRYARQLILPSFGVAGQLALKTASVAIIGAGGLGCPAALYLAGAGVGRLTIIDGDTVESSNLHRQIGHTADRVGIYKADSLVAACKARNPLVEYVSVRDYVTVDNIEQLLRPRSEHKGCNQNDNIVELDKNSSEESELDGNRKANVVLDCTDHAAIRYLVSDACVLMGVPLVSAAALRTDGQLAVLNWPVGRGPCYRCVFPRPPPSASQTSCAEGGVLGPVVGVMGILQALETIRILTKSPLRKGDEDSPTLLLFSANDGGPLFRTVRLRGQRADCFACGNDAPLKSMNMQDGGLPDYAQFCGESTAAAQAVLLPEERVSVQAYRRIREEDGEESAGKGARTHWLLDVREKEFYALGSISGAINIPFSLITSSKQSSEGERLPGWLPKGIVADMAPIYLICRLGNDSQVATRQLKSLGVDQLGTRFVGDIVGGLLAWKTDIDSTFPFV